MRSLLAILLFAAACAPRSETPPAFDLANYTLVDLTHSFNAQTIYWPTSTRTFEHPQQSFGKTPGGWFYSSYELSTPEHGGTHLDAPVHFAEGRHAAEAVPLEQLIAPAVVVDVSAKAATDPVYRLTRADVEAWEKHNGRIEPGTIVLLRTGWGKRWPDRKAYFGGEAAESKLRFPSYGVDAAQLLLERRIAALGVDTASIDHGPSTDFAVHVLVNGADVPAFENVANIDALPERGAIVIALPMKVAGGSGGPLRIVALVPR